MFKFIQNAICLAAAVVGFSAMNISSAAAQVETLQTCGANVESNVATSRFSRTVTSTTFVDFFTGRFLITPGIAADCVVVTFNAESVCKGASTADQCLIRATVNGVELLPAPTEEDRVFDSESSGPSSHVYSWVKRGLLTGNQDFKIQVRVGAAGTSFVIDDWTLHIQYFS